MPLCHAWRLSVLFLRLEVRSDILTKEELKAFAEHPFYYDKIELLEKLKTRTRELLAIYVPLYGVNIHSLRHYISLVPGGIHESFSLYIKVASIIINDANRKSMSYNVEVAFEDYMIECADYFDGYFDQTMTEKLKDLSGAIISFQIENRMKSMDELGGTGYDR